MGVVQKTVSVRYVLGPEHVREKERFAQKEREEAIRKARERKREDIKAKERLRRQIEEDRRCGVLQKGCGTQPER